MEQTVSEFKENHFEVIQYLEYNKEAKEEIG